MSPQSEQSPGHTTNKLVSISPAIKEKKKKKELPISERVLVLSVCMLLLTVC
jgi:hypothetical protein